MDQVNDPFVFPADEWYVIAESPFPSLNRYGSLPQLGNGVGLVPLFQRQWKRGLRSLRSPLERPLIFATGMAFAPYLESLVTMSESAFPHLGGKMTVMGVSNGYFGPSVTVAGLMSARDIIAPSKMETIRKIRFFVFRTSV